MQLVFRMFTPYLPLNQGLKQYISIARQLESGQFTPYLPLNQGLKHIFNLSVVVIVNGFTPYLPLNQGLKLSCFIRLLSRYGCLPLTFP